MVFLLMAALSASVESSTIIGIYRKSLFEYQIQETIGFEKQSEEIWIIDEIAAKWPLITKL